MKCSVKNSSLDVLSYNCSYLHLTKMSNSGKKSAGSSELTSSAAAHAIMGKQYRFGVVQKVDDWEQQPCCTRHSDSKELLLLVVAAAIGGGVWGRGSRRVIHLVAAGLTSDMLRFRRLLLLLLVLVIRSGAELDWARATPSPATENGEAQQATAALRYP